MTEIFYRLLSQANGKLYLLEQDERFDLAKSVVEKLRIGSAAEKQLLVAIRLAEVILNKFENKELLHPISGISISERKELASQCVQIQDAIYKGVNNWTDGVEYKSMSNEKFAELIGSEITEYFFVALYLKECRGKLLSYLLVGKPW